MCERFLHEISQCAARRFKLTGRQQEVLFYILAGLSHEQIAMKLTISVSTVKYHTSNIYRLLQVHSYQECLAKVYVAVVTDLKPVGSEKAASDNR